MKRKFYSNSIIFLRLLGRCFTTQYDVSSLHKAVSPAVYIVHHQNLQGPISTMIWINTPLHIWALSPFCKLDTCYRHYMKYTFTKRFGMSKLLASIIAFPVSFLVSGLLQSLQVIPVYRGSRDIIKTIKQSVSALIDGESLLICPDIDYTDTSSEMGKMYDGYLNLDKYYFQKTNQHIAFIPLHISKSKHCIYVGDEIFPNDNINFKKEKEELHLRLKEEFSRLERLGGVNESAA